MHQPTVSLIYKQSNLSSMHAILPTSVSHDIRTYLNHEVNVLSHCDHGETLLTSDWTSAM